ncbi:MAG: hypothetical protein JW772_01805 [Candidatus Diapherotrites archaeon]|nr:hypothetical protein [Candidatus Diapherotrites archaeon]
MKKMLLGIVLVFLFSAANASSVTGEFSFECDCLTVDRGVFTLTNDASQSQTFTISAAGDTKDWINLNGQWIGQAPLKVTLGAGESVKLYAFVDPPGCYITPGNYVITVNFSSPLENFSQSLNVEIKASRFVNIDLNKENIALKQCEKEELDLTVTNTGKSDELVFVSVTGLPGAWVDYSTESFILEKGASKKMKMLIEPPCSAQAKKYPFEIKAVIQNTGFTVAKSLSLEIIDAQQIQISSNPLKACGDKETTMPIRIKNIGRLDDSIEVSASGLDWAVIQPTILSLAPEEEAVVNATFKKTNAGTQDYTFTVKAHSRAFNKTTEKEFTVSLVDCYGVTIKSVNANSQDTESPEACIEEKLEYVFELENDKAMPIEIDVSLRGANALITPSKATIAPGATESFTIKIDLSQETAGEHNFDLVIDSDYFSMTREFKFTVVDCYALDVDYDGLNNTIEVEACYTTEEGRNPYIVTMKNTGTKAVTVTATVSGMDWVYFQPGVFDINPQDEKQIYVYFDPPYDTRHGLYKADLRITAKYIEHSKVVDVKVFGGLYAELGDANVSASGKLGEIIEETEKKVEVSLSIRNDSNSMLRVENFNAIGYNAEFDFTPTSLTPQETLEVKMTLLLGKDFEETVFTVPVRITTDKGSVTREVEVDLNAPIDQEPEPIPLSGFFGLGSLRDLALVGLIVIVLAIVLVMIFKSGTKEEKEEKEPESYWQPPEEKNEKITSAGLAELGKKIRAKPKSKSRAKPKRKFSRKPKTRARKR